MRDKLSRAFDQLEKGRTKWLETHRMEEERAKALMALIKAKKGREQSLREQYEKLRRSAEQAAEAIRSAGKGLPLPKLKNEKAKAAKQAAKPHEKTVREFLSDILGFEEQDCDEDAELWTQEEEEEKKNHEPGGGEEEPEEKKKEKESQPKEEEKKNHEPGGGEEEPEGQKEEPKKLKRLRRLRSQEAEKKKDKESQEEPKEEEKKNHEPGGAEGGGGGGGGGGGEGGGEGGGGGGEEEPEGQEDEEKKKEKKKAQKEPAELSVAETKVAHLLHKGEKGFETWLRSLNESQLEQIARQIFKEDKDGITGYLECVKSSERMSFCSKCRYKGCEYCSYEHSLRYAIRHEKPAAWWLRSSEPAVIAAKRFLKRA